MRPHLRFGLTPCPNDTYVVAAVALRRLALRDTSLDIELHDIETLNRGALAGDYDIVKISCALYPELEARYALLDVGAAIADGYGPLVLARSPDVGRDLAHARIVAPGTYTTGAALFRLFAPQARAVEHRRYDQIVPSLSRGEFDAGVVIHESRLTYQAYGLHCVIDLGAWWTRETGLPVALGCYVMRRDLYARYGAALEALLRESLSLADGGDQEIEAYIRRHAQEFDETVLREYIRLYVNAYTRSLGATGRAAVETFATRLRALAA